MMSSQGGHAVDVLVSKLRRRQIIGSRETAIETVLVLRQVVAKARFTDIDQLVQLIKEIGKRLVEAQPKEHTVGNTVRKVLHHIREEYQNAAGTSQSMRPNLSLSTFVLLGHPKKQIDGPPRESTAGSLKESTEDDPDAFAKTLKPVLMEAIQDVLDELETVYENIGKVAKDHIHSDEIIFTIGKSKTVETFLRAAASSRKYTVIVSETSPSYGGHAMAEALSAAGISTILVPDSSAYALMSRVNKVIIGAHAILANGGMFAVTGSSLVTTAAKAHSVPVAVCAGQFKFTPLWNLYHEYSALDFSDPSNVLGFEEGDLVDKVDVVNPYYDYVEPGLIDVYITNDGDHPPASIYRLVKETYDDEDTEL